jgi:hypothetical protein
MRRRGGAIVIIACGMTAKVGVVIIARPRIAVICVMTLELTMVGIAPLEPMTVGVFTSGVFAIGAASVLVAFVKNSVCRSAQGVGCGAHGIAETTFETTFTHYYLRRRLTREMTAMEVLCSAQ